MREAHAKVEAAHVVLRRANDAHAVGRESRAAMAHAKGREHLQAADRVGIELSERRVAVAVLACVAALGRGAYLLERFLERCEAIAVHFEPDCCSVAAVRTQVLAAHRQRVAQVDPALASAAAAADVALPCDQDRGLAGRLRDARGDDTEHARMPIVASEHDGGAGLLGCEVDGLILQLALDLAPFLVVALQNLRGGLRLDDAGRAQQSRRVESVADAASCVDQRRDAERNVLDVRRAIGQARRVEQRADAGAPALRERAQAVPHKSAVLAA